MEKLSKIIQKTNFSEISKIELKPRWAEVIIEKYKSSENLLILFNPSKQSEFMSKSLNKCFNGSAPSITRVRVSFGQETAKNWIIAQLIDLSLFTGIKEKPEMIQIEAIADTIICNYGFLKLTELMVFFQRFKAGKHGIFYGAIDGIVINAGIKDFLNYRSIKLSEIENKV